MHRNKTNCCCEWRKVLRFSASGHCCFFASSQIFRCFCLVNIQISCYHSSFSTEQQYSRTMSFVLVKNGNLTQVENLRIALGFVYPGYVFLARSPGSGITFRPKAEPRAAKPRELAGQKQRLDRNRKPRKKSLWHPG